MDINKELCVVYATDDNYAPYMGISMLSLFEHNKRAEQVTVFVLDSGIRQENREKLSSIAEQYGRKLVFLSVEGYADKLDLHMAARKISVVSYMRLFMASVIPEEYDRVIYLDCDMIIHDDLMDMFTTPFGNALVAGVQDAVDTFFAKKIALPDGIRYINAGMLLINLKAWREEHMQEKFLTYIEEMNGTVPHHDQGVINHTCAERRVVLPLKYNVTSNTYSFSEKDVRRMYGVKGEYYSQKEIEAARKAPAIIHYTTGVLGRPWEEGCEHPHRNLYEEALNASPWKGMPLKPNKMGLVVRVSAFVCNHISSRLFAEIFRVMSFTTHHL